MNFPIGRWIFSLVASVLPPAAAAQADAHRPGEAPFATVGDAVISQDEYRAALAAATRQKYYHARPPAHELEAFRREVGDTLVQRALLLSEAASRGIEADRAQVDRAVAEYDRRYAASELWNAQRERLLPQLVDKLARESVLEQLERRVRSAPAATEAQARAYYERHPDRFTEPEQVRVSLILLRVDPAAPGLAWERAHDEARGLRERLRRGADFASLARAHSADPSASNGGDLGYLHRGMLPEAIHATVIDALQPGEISAPVALLEGIALVRLEERRAARRRGFDESRPRAAELAEREAADAQWKDLIADLRSRTRIRIDETRYLPVAAD